jgi:hypothetical protein
VLGQRRGDRRSVAQNLCIAAALASRSGASEAAARVLGGADSVCKELDLALESAEASLVEELRSGLRRELGEKRYEAFLAEGRELTLDEAVELALATVPESQG